MKPIEVTCPGGEVFLVQEGSDRAKDRLCARHHMGVRERAFTREELDEQDREVREKRERIAARGRG